MQCMGLALLRRNQVTLVRGKGAERKETHDYTPHTTHTEPPCFRFAFRRVQRRASNIDAVLPRRRNLYTVPLTEATFVMQFSPEEATPLMQGPTQRRNLSCSHFPRRGTPVMFESACSTETPRVRPACGTDVPAKAWQTIC